MPRRKDEYTCIYCGRFMDDAKAVHVVKDLPYSQRLYSCKVCKILVENLIRAKTLYGRQDAIRRVFGGQLLAKAEQTPEGMKFAFVNRDGYEEMKLSIADRPKS